MTEITDDSPSTITTTTGKPPQISEMFQKFALAFKTKTFEFFAADDEHDPSDSEGFTLLDSAEDFITDQKVVVIKPDRPPNVLQQSPPKSPSSTSNSSLTDTQVTKSEQSHNLLQKSTVTKCLMNIQLTQTLTSSIFGTVSSFEASYLQLQAAHVPFVEENIKAADRALVSHLQRLSDFKQFYRDFCKNPDFIVTEEDLAIGSCLEHRVQENQSKLRTLETVSNRLQEEIDQKDSQVAALRNQLGEMRKCNSNLSKKLSNNLNSSFDVLLTVRVFDSMLHDACRATQRFTKILIDLMTKAGWDLNLAANSVYHDIDYAKKGHNRYAFLSYVCLGMFRGFDLEGFGLVENEACNGHDLDYRKTSCSMKQLLEHVSSNPLEMISMNHNCEFSRFCERKYQELIHPTMESSIFSNLEQNEVILNSWRSLSVFYESFVNMTSSIWMLHKLACSFDPVVDIFQVERGVDFSLVYMEDVTRRRILAGKTRAKVGFTVVPGFKVGRTVIQSQVYLHGMKCTK